MKSRALLLVALLALGACAAPGTLRYHTLLGEAPPRAASVDAKPAFRVAIAPVTLPEALDRPQLVLRVAPNQLTVADAERWAEPLKREIARVLAQQLGARLPAAYVATSTQYGAQQADYRVLVDVLRFDAAPGKSVTLEADWSLRDRTGVRLREGRSARIEQLSAPGIDLLVSAHSRALETLSADIADALKSIAKRSRNQPR